MPEADEASGGSEGARLLALPFSSHASCSTHYSWDGGHEGAVEEDAHRVKLRCSRGVLHCTKTFVYCPKYYIAAEPCILLVIRARPGRKR